MKRALFPRDHAIEPASLLSSEDEEWDAFVNDCPGGTIFQTSRWAEARGFSGWSAHRRCVRDAAGTLRAGAAVGTRRIGPWLVAYSQRGPVWKDALGLWQLLREMQDWARGLGAALIKVNPDLSSDDPDLEIFREAGFRSVAGEAYAHRATYRMDLTVNETAQHARAEGRTRRAAERAGREGVVVDMGDDAALLRRFAALSADTGRRRGFPAPAPAFLERLRSGLAPEGRFLVSVARRELRDVSAAVHLFHGGRCTYMWGGSSGDAALKRCGASEALHFAVMDAARDRGMREYDLHGIPLDAAGNPSGGLALFKRGFGGELHRLVGDLDLPLRPTLYRAWRRLEPLYLRSKGVRG